MELGGLQPGTQYDTLSITGTAELGGLLDVDLFGGFSPILGDSFDLLEAETIFGEFDFLSLALLGSDLFLDIEYLLDPIEMDIVRLSVASSATVPLPPAFWLFLTGLSVLYRAARTKTGVRS